MTAGVGKLDEKPAGAWMAMVTVEYILERVQSVDLYILVPDNKMRREVDQLRMQ